MIWCPSTKAVDVRMMRREAVAEQAELHFVTDELVVRRVVGSPRTMAGQIARMMEESERSPTSDCGEFSQS